MRDTCILCACKHLAQARILLNEGQLGYPEHYWFALGHFAEAEDELVSDHPYMAGKVRTQRKRLETYPKHQPPFAELILEIARFGGYDINELDEEV